MKKTGLIIVCVMFIVFGVLTGAGAVTVTPSTTPQWTGLENNMPAILAKLNSTISGFGDLKLLLEVQAPDEASGLTINNDIAGAEYLLVKDGRHAPAWYLFDLQNLNPGGAWNGTDPLVLSGFWPGPGAISNVRVYGAPEPTSLLLIGLGLVGVAGLRRILR